MVKPNSCSKCTLVRIKHPIFNNEEVNSLNSLNEDCLMHIFRFLPIVDRVRIERVCKHWQLLSRRSWQDFNKLDLENSYWGFKNSNTLNKINSRTLKKVLSRCGKFILCIMFYENNKRLGPNVLAIVAKFCPNIQYVFATRFLISSKCIQNLAERCTQLVSFHIGDCLDNCDEELSLLFKNNKKLEGLGVYGNSKVTGLCLRHLNKESIRTIIFQDCASVFFNYFNVVKTFPNLEILIIEHFHYANNRTMKLIGSCTKNLKFLTLSLSSFYSDSFHHVANLTNLYSLDLSYNVSVNDAVLAAIAANCMNLGKLQISFCNSVTNLGLSKIVSLPQLRSLVMKGLDQVTDDVFKSMPRLMQLDCSYCTNLRDPGLIKLIESSDEMEYLYLCSCVNVSNGFLEAAIRATQKRNNNIILKIYLSNTSVKVAEASDTSPFLQVVPLIIVDHFK